MINVSLIIPVYNTGRYIQRALRSALDQTCDEMEIILVDDATPDNAMTIAKQVLSQYSDRKKQVHILTHPQNKGLAAARQTGFDKSTGEYIIHMDSDDWCDPTMVEELYAKAKQEDADVVICDYYATLPDKECYMKQFAPASGKECAALMLSGDLHGSVCNKLVRRELYTQNHIVTYPGLNFLEDLLASVRLCFKAERVAYLNRAFLHYVQDNPTSYINTISERSLQNVRDVTDLLIEFYRENGALETHEEAIRGRKIFVKNLYLRRTPWKKRKRLATLYPEVNHYLPHQPGSSFSQRCTWYFAIHRLWIPTYCMLHGVRIVKKIMHRA